MFVVNAQIDMSKATSALDKLANEIDKAVQQALEESAQSAIEGAKGVVPVRTGRLRDSIGIKQRTKDSILVAADTPYAAAVEFGASGRAARPYIGVQADRMQSEASRILGEAIKRII